MALLEPQVGQETLEQTPERLLRFLLAISRYPNIRRRLRTRGYGRQQHQLAYRVLEELGAYDEDSQVDSSDPDVKAALQTLNELDEETLTLVAAALRYKLPLHHAFMLDGLASSTDAGQAAKTIGALLDRMARLESGKVDEALKADAAAALQAMSEKGLDASWRQRVGQVRDLLRTLPEEEVTEEQLKQREQARMNKLLEVRALFEEWADTARVEFKGRRDLIRLGLASLRRGNNGSEEVVEPVAAPSVSGFPTAAEDQKASAAE